MWRVLTPGVQRAGIADRSNSTPWEKSRKKGRLVPVTGVRSTVKAG